MNMILFCIALFVASAILYFPINQYVSWLIHQQNVDRDRYVVTTSMIYKKINDEEDETDDPLLRKLLGKDEKTSSDTFHVRLCIDLEEVSNFCEWTLGAKDDEGNPFADSTMVYMKNGDSIIILESFDVMEAALVNYLDKRVYGRKG